MLTKQETEALHESAKRGPSALAGAVTAWLEAKVRRAAVQLARTDPRRCYPLPLADCKPGCNHCCHLMITLQGPELFRLARHVQREWDGEQVEGLKDRLRRHALRTRGLDSQAVALAKVPCPFLEGGLCSIYRARPLACAGYSSTDARDCERSLEVPGQLTYQVSAYRNATIEAANALATLCGHKKWPAQEYEMVRALLIVLEDPRAEAEWRAGRDVLAPAAVGRHAGPGGTHTIGCVRSESVNADV